MPDLPPPLPAPTWRARLEQVADALGVSLARLVAIAAGGLALVVVVALVTVLGVGRGGAGATPELGLPRVGSAGDPGAGSGGSPGDPDGAAAPVTTAGQVFVHAAGAVARPGVYRVRSGARVADVIDAAGGPTADADVDRLNLAARVEDGQRVYVPRRGEAVEAGDASAAGAPGSSGARAGKATDAVLDLNTASAADLETLPGIGPSLAQAIVDYRTKHKRFRSVDELLEVRGIGEAKLNQIRPRVRVGGG